MSFAIVPKLTFKSKVCYRVFCHGIAKMGDCKVVIYNYILCWLYSMKKSAVIALILFIVFCGILLYFVRFYCIGFNIKSMKNQACIG